MRDAAKPIQGPPRQLKPHQRLSSPISTDRKTHNDGDD